MPRRVTFPFSGEHLDLAEINGHFKDLSSALALYFSSNSPAYSVRFALHTPDQVKNELQKRLEELERTESMKLLASLEALFRIDYITRCELKLKDPLSRAFRALFKRRKERASLEDEIFDAWLDHSSGAEELIGKLRGAFKFRHWLAHGRYWEPKLGRRYDYLTIYELAERTVNSFPFYGVAP